MESELTIKQRKERIQATLFLIVLATAVFAGFMALLASALAFLMLLIS